MTLGWIWIAERSGLESVCSHNYSYNLVVARLTVNSLLTDSDMSENDLALNSRCATYADDHIQRRDFDSEPENADIGLFSSNLTVCMNSF
jgi:hypothetical protein